MTDRKKNSGMKEKYLFSGVGEEFSYFQAAGIKNTVYTFEVS